jgi:2-isopropylmalate synthase
MKDDKIIIFDTTLRDGEQAPGASMNIQEKLLIAKILEQMNVDVIEAGFPAASDGDFAAVNNIAKNITKSSICGLARAKKDDITKVAQAIAPAPRKRIHTFIATSPIHMDFKLKMDKSQVLETIKDSVSFARNLCDEVDWSCEDATRSDHDFLFKAIEVAINAGANVINIPDTVGYSIPEDYYNLVKAIKENVTNIDKAIISTHCHNDLGLAVANSLSAIQAGARQVECTINGIGERAGNCALEEIVMTLKTRFDHYKIDTKIDTTLISRASKLVSNITGFPVQYNKAIVGANAFAHESGIHQDGMLKNRNTYEIMTPESIGLQKSSLILGKHSGRAAFKERITSIGYELSEEQIEANFIKFKNLADKKKEILDDDIIAIIDDSISHKIANCKLIDLDVKCGNNKEAVANIKIQIQNQKYSSNFSSSDGPVDAIFKAIDQIIKHDSKLELYQVQAVTEGTDSLATVIVRMRFNKKLYSGNGSNSDVLTASAIAYINCLEKFYCQ